MKNDLFCQKKLFLMSLISSIIICISSNSLFSMWMSMEINLFSMIPLMSINQKFFSEKSTMTYFLIQGISSSLTLTAISSMNMENMKTLSTFILFLSLFMKLGLFPFHYWMISTIEGLSWKLAFVLMSIQKIIPMIIMLQMFKTKIVIFLCILNSFIAATSGMTSFSLRKLMGFSSMNHLSIMLISLLLSKKTLKIYFLIYSIMTFTATKTMEKLNLNFLSQTMIYLKQNKLNNMIMMFIFLSMAGMPPFLGFMPKMITVMMMMKAKMFLTSIFILVFNTLTTFFYLRISMNNFILNLNHQKTVKTNKIIKFPIYLILSPLMILLTWNFKLNKTINFQN